MDIFVAIYGFHYIFYIVGAISNLINYDVISFTAQRMFHARFVCSVKYNSLYPVPVGVSCLSSCGYRDVMPLG